MGCCGYCSAVGWVLVAFGCSLSLFVIVFLRLLLDCCQALLVFSWDRSASYVCSQSVWPFGVSFSCYLCLAFPGCQTAVVSAASVHDCDRACVLCGRHFSGWLLSATYGVVWLVFWDSLTELVVMW